MTASTVTTHQIEIEKTSELTDASRQSLPGSIVTVPTSYTKRDVIGVRGRGRQ